MFAKSASSQSGMPRSRTSRRINKKNILGRAMGFPRTLGSTLIVVTKYLPLLRRTDKTRGKHRCIPITFSKSARMGSCASLSHETMADSMHDEFGHRTKLIWTHFGDVRMWLQLMWLQFEVVRGPVGVVWGRIGTGPDPRLSSGARNLPEESGSSIQ